MATIMGPSADTTPSVPITRVTIGTPPGAPMAVPMVSPSCTLGAQNAFPMPRLFYFSQQFPDRNSFFSLCNDDDNDGQADLQKGLDLIAQLIRRVVGNPCFESDINTTDLDPNNPGLQLECSVSEVTGPGTATATATILPSCEMANDTTPATNTVQPCWYVKPDPVQCAAFPTKLVFATYPEDRAAPPDTHMIVECVVAN